MAFVKDIYEFINRIAPFDIKTDYDNVGLLVGDPNKNVKKAIVTLDITSEVVLEAKKQNAELIISHHPVIPLPIKKLNSQSVPYLLAQNNISAICAHTNLDMAQKIGVNACLADVLDVKNLKPLSYCNKTPLAMYGELSKKMKPKEFANYVKEKLQCNFIKYFAGEKEIKSIGFCSGGAGEFINEAVENNLDAYISGDIKHHEFLIASEAGVTTIDAGHYNTENIVVRPLAELLNKNFYDVSFEISKVNKDIVSYV